ncbi:lipase maturation factor 2, partial [Toxoplasma gondii VAND]
MHAPSRSSAGGGSPSEVCPPLQGAAASSHSPPSQVDSAQETGASAFASSFSTAALRSHASSSASLGASGAASLPHSSRVPSDDTQTRVSIFNLLPPSACRAISYLLVCGLSLSALSSLATYFHVAVLQVILFGIALSYALAFLSLARQADGLIGPKVGILPLDELMPALEQRARVPASPHVKFVMKAVHQVATLVCRNKSNVLPSHLAYGGVAISIFCAGLSFTALGWPRALWQTACFAALYVEYLAFRYMARDFLSFQWDVLLLECGFIAVCASPCSTAATPFAAGVSVMSFRLLAFKLLFCSGICKLASGDQKWSSFTAMNYHYWTQPLPNFVSWHSYWGGNKRLQAIGAVTFEILGPLLILFGRWGRIVAFFCFVLLIVSIYVTGNYGFFNILSCVVCLALLDDSLLLFKFPSPLENA